VTEQEPRQQSDEVLQPRIGCGPVGVLIVAGLALCCVLLTIGSGLVILFPGQFVDLFDRDDGDPDRLRVTIGADGTPTITVARDEPLGSASNPAPLGTSLSGDGLTITLHSVTPVPSILEAVAPAGSTYLILDVTLVNTTDEPREFSAFYWSARDILTDENFDDEKDIRPANALLAGSLAPGVEVRGNVLLLIDLETPILRIKYDTDIFGGQNMYWLWDAHSPSSVASPEAVVSQS
jgi:hypothetical protein